MGSLFLAAVETCAESVRAFPDAGRVVREEIRRQLAGGFPYAVLYRVTGDHLRVLATMHTKRRPTYWAGRQ
ncbi:MAG: type II toxin-antitoxin system RelE/ParE family toxin [Acidobacteria bacterium]|nr:type II toxin-antitoxin system RelE/ParE family toxin [Acidobacteriota bacterium]MYA45774.1 type II toxin-antitoxin system RelE/ParE family toxin [Acidobacteriota bacterium]MYB31401.1 type II toxin-antitoxin system RelE/ParE family toxin [Acidobacteriota bacterium]MYH23323.1 type II toxin-antitoxin system RelE/ParE family toxin [Acidobacteriota bacterium]MYI40196.1 type II toxin-antitoxin system RelE/ParE family toxin [Acidobacteriota bacterium]